MIRTQAQNAAFHQLLTLHKFDREDKAELVYLVSGERTRSSAELSMAEMATAIKRLEAGNQASMKKMKAKIYNIARDIFGMKGTDAWGQKHYDAVDTFMLSKFKTRVCFLTYEHLPDAVTAMEAWRKTATKKLVKTLLNPT